MFDNLPNQQWHSLDHMMAVTQARSHAELGKAGPGKEQDAPLPQQESWQGAGLLERESMESMGWRCTQEYRNVALHGMVEWRLSAERGPMEVLRGSVRIGHAELRRAVDVDRLVAVALRSRWQQMLVQAVS